MGDGYEEAWRRVREVHDFGECVKPHPSDHIISQHHQIERLLKARGIVNLLYVGFLLNVCLLEKPGGILRTKMRYRTILLRDCTAASELAWSTDENVMTKAFVHWLELLGTSTALSDDLLQALAARRIE
jgi:nicotinamidase-related amidase